MNVLVVFAPVGRPLIVPAWLSVNPAGRLPDANVTERGATPPVTGIAKLYGTPFDPLGGKVVPNVGASTTLMETVAVRPVSAMEVALNETDNVAEMPVGAVYNTLLVVAFVSVPQPAPEQLVVLKSQVTPLLSVSLARVAMNGSDCPVSIIWVVPGII